MFKKSPLCLCTFMLKTPWRPIPFGFTACGTPPESAGSAESRRSTGSFDSQHGHVEETILGPRANRAQKCGRIGTKIRQTFKRIVGFSCLCWWLVIGFWGVNYSKIANLGFWTYCLFFVSIFGNFNKSDQIWTLRPLIHYRNPSKI